MNLVQAISEQYKKMDATQKDELVQFIFLNLTKNVNDEGTETVEACPHCGSKKFKKNGRQHDVQRYKCKSCFKNFRAATDTVFFALKKKDKITAFIAHMLEEKSLRQLAKDVNISLNTSWDWKRKIVNELAELPEHLISVKAEEILAV